MSMTAHRQIAEADSELAGANMVESMKTDVGNEENAPSRPLLVAAFGLCVVIAFAPLPFGSMDLRVVAGWILVLSAILLLNSAQTVNSRDLVFLMSCALITGCWLLVLSTQLDYLAPLSQKLEAPIWKQAAVALGSNKPIGSASVARNQPLFSAGAQISCMLSLLCGYLVGRNSWSAHLLLLSFVGSALAYSLYGIVAFVLRPDHLLWHQKYNYLNSLTATFVNPNVAATYFGAGTLACVLILAASTRRRFVGSPRGWGEFFGSTLPAASPRTTFCLLASFLLLATTLMTGSRAGSVLSLMAIAGALGTYYRRALRARGLLLAFPVLSLLVVLATISILAPRVNERFGTQGFFDAGRLQAYGSTLAIIKDYPWFGTGLGTLRWAFPAYRSGDIPSYGVWEHAHNTTLEIASEMGIPFATVIAAGWLAVLCVLGRGMLTRKRDVILPTAAFWIGLLALVHSQLDFPLQIPGFTLAVCPLLGMGIAQSWSQRGSQFTEFRVSRNEAVHSPNSSLKNT